MTLLYLPFSQSRSYVAGPSTIQPAGVKFNTSHPQVKSSVQDRLLDVSVNFESVKQSYFLERRIFL
jgi:hypothetical protein